jgi:hypothetical protein
LKYRLIANIKSSNAFIETAGNGRASSGGQAELNVVEGRYFFFFGGFKIRTLQIVDNTESRLGPKPSMLLAMLFF